MRVAIYARFSTDRQSANSAEDQVTICADRAAREGWEVVGVYTDLAMSGTSNRRPGMTAMLADATAGSFDIVMAEALDRIARNQADIATIYQRLEFASVAIETLSEGRVNELHIGLKGTMGALFLKDLADKIRRGQRGCVTRGRVPGGLTYGYDVAPRLNAKGEVERGLRVINEEQAAVVRRIYREYIAGMGPKAIAHALNADGIPSPGGVEWRASSIAGHRARGLGVLHNPVYAGRYRYNRVTMRRDPDSRKRVSRVNSAADQMVVEMPELRIIDEATWQIAQDQAAERSRGPISQHIRPKHLLSGLVRCGGCGGSVTIVGGQRLGCIRHREAGTCPVKKTILRDELEGRVLIGLTDHLLAPDAVSLLVKSYHAEMAEQQAADRAMVATIERRIKSVDRAIERLVAAIADGAADFREIRESLAARKAERDQLIREQAESQADSVIVMNPRIVEAYRKRVRLLAQSISKAEGVEQAEVKQRLRELIVAVKITPTNTDWNIEMLSSLGSVVSMATERQIPRKGSAESARVVAEEGLEPPTPGL